MAYRRTNSRFTTPACEGIAATAAGVASEEVVFQCPDVTSDRDSGYDSLPYGQPSIYTVKAAYITPDTTQAGADTNTATITLEVYSSTGTSRGTLATLALTNGVNLTARNRRSFGTLVAARVGLRPGDVVTAKIVKLAAGLATPKALITLDIV